MGKIRGVLLFAIITAGLPLQGCATDSPEQLIHQHDHAALANYYLIEAKKLEQKAKDWDFMADFYEKHPDPSESMGAAEHAAHCRTIAQNYRKAADEAAALASEHRRQRPHGMIN